VVSEPFRFYARPGSTEEPGECALCKAGVPVTNEFADNMGWHATRVMVQLLTDHPNAVFRPTERMRPLYDFLRDEGCLTQDEHDHWRITDHGRERYPAPYLTEEGG
jgi:hypothetical protein